MDWAGQVIAVIDTGAMNMTDAERAQLRALADAATSAPWRVATEDDVSDNWLVCMGRSLDGHTYYVTTDHVHASELEGDARNDAEFIAACRLGVPKLVDALASTTQRAEQAEREANSWIQAADDERTKLRHALAIARGRAEAAEAAARAKGDEWAQSIQHATVFRERWEAAEAKLAAIPLDALLYCFRTEIEEREFEDWELYSDAIDIWIDTIVADRLAQLRPSKEAQP